MAARSTLTVVSGTTITSAWGNSVRDHAVPFTTSDDVSSNGQVAFNTANQRLIARVAGVTLPIGGRMPRVRVTPLLTSLTLPSAGSYLVNWNNEVFDTDNMYNAASSGSAIVAAYPGAYQFSYQLSWFSPSAKATFRSHMQVNGAGFHAAQESTTDGTTAHSGSTTLWLAAGDTVQLVATVTGTASVNILGSADYLQASYMHPV